MKSFEKFVKDLVSFRDQQMKTIQHFKLVQEVHPKDRLAARVIRLATRKAVVVEELLRILNCPVESTLKNYVVKIFASGNAPQRKKEPGAQKPVPAKRKRLSRENIEKVIKVITDIH